tara:strand:- start:89 stop:1549 length:1461 start_codon:yes stop_codon:yes gene_type:complete
MKEKDTNIGHNNPPKSLDEMIDERGRVEIRPRVMSLLKPMPDPDDPKGERYKEVVINDALIMGFKAKVNPGGSRSYFYQYRPKGIDEIKTAAAKAKEPGADAVYLNPVKVHLGKYVDKKDEHRLGSGITPAVARKLCKDIIEAIKVGKDPVSIVAARRKSKTLAAIFDEFFKVRVKSAAFKEKSRTDIASRKKLYIDHTTNGYKHTQLRSMNKEALSIGYKKLVDLTKDDYVKFHTAVSKAGKIQANRCIEDLRLVEKYAFEKEYIKKTVCHFRKKELNTEVKRIELDDPYDRDEMRRIRKAALARSKSNDGKSFTSCMGLLACMYIGGRSKDMIFNMQWDQVSMPKNVIRYKETKNDKPINLEFIGTAKAILKIMLRLRHKTNPRDKRFKFVFPSNRSDSEHGHIMDPRKVWKHICSDAKVAYKPIHFLRHTWATNAYEAFGDIEAVRQMGGWLDIKSVQIYATLVDKRKAKYAATLNRYLKSHA